VSIDFAINRQQFDNMIAGYVDRTVDLCRNVLATAGLEPRDISDVIMVGGSTRIPLVRQRVAELFGKEPATRINPDEVVAQGAAVQAAMLGSQPNVAVPAHAGAQAEHDVPMDLGFTDEDTVQDKAPTGTEPLTYPQDDNRPVAVGTERGGFVAPSKLAGNRPAALLLDVTSATLRIATAGGYTEVFLERNSPIPIERTRLFTTAHAEQTEVLLQCCRGESRLFDENELLGTLTLKDIPPAPRGEAQIEVTFRVDPDGILHVRGLDMRTQRQVEATLMVVGAPTRGAA
jgi:molecular chaperone DnaK (HSP70)